MLLTKQTHDLWHRMKIAYFYFKFISSFSSRVEENLIPDLPPSPSINIWYTVPSSCAERHYASRPCARRRNNNSMMYPTVFYQDIVLLFKLRFFFLLFFIIIIIIMITFDTITRRGPEIAADWVAWRPTDEIMPRCMLLV